MSSQNYMMMILGAFLLSATALSSWSWVLNFSILNLGTLNMSISIFLEKYNTVFMLTVLTIFSMVFLYSLSYMAEEVYIKRFLAILSLFVLSMCILILSSSLFSSLIGWDGLGVTSLFLILFYYSKSAFKAGTLTFLMNRVGDCFFILTLTQIFLLGEVQIIMSYNSFPTEIIMLLILTSITKSAQIPFSTWLPAAMEAPTPVSALVHSSTLVTAGIYLMYRYKTLWMDSSLKDILMVLSLGTSFMAAMSALVENDLKKLIALSTLSQLGFIVLSLSLGLAMQGFLHMIMHAYFKALLFMCAGLMIHSFKGSQSILKLSLSGKQNPLLMTIMSCSLMSMSGLPFLSGFYSKDYIIDVLKSSQWSLVMLILLVMSFIFTVLYSIRMSWYLLNSSNSWHCMSDTDLGMIKPMIPLTVISVLGGSTSIWLLVENETYIDSSKVFIVLLLVATAGFYWMSKSILTSAFLESKWNLSTFNPILSGAFFSSIWLYKDSSDLLGVPEMLNKQINRTLTKGSAGVMKTMFHYSGEVEFFLFLLAVIFMM